MHFNHYIAEAAFAKTHRRTEAEIKEAVRQLRQLRRTLRAKYNENHDEHGRFGSGGGGGDSSGGSGSGGSSPSEGGGGGSAHPIIQAKHTDPSAFKNTTWKSEPKKLYQQTPNDQNLAKILQQQGFDGKPHLVSDAQLDAYIKNGEPEVLRGMEGGQGYAEQFQSGPLFAGRGLYGGGTYTVAGREGTQAVMSKYAGSDGQVLRMSIKSGANIANYDTLVNEMHAYQSQVEGTPFANISKDVGRYAAMRGYDVVYIGSSHDNGTNNIPQYLILNRTAVRVSTTIGGT